MASGSRSLLALALAVLCALLARSSAPSGFALAGRSSRFSRSPGRRGVAAHYKVLLETSGGAYAFDCPADRTLLSVIREEAEGSRQQPGSWACEEGVCSSCLGHISAGDVEQESGTLLSEEMQRQGLVLCCMSKPTSDVVINAMFMNEEHWDDAMLGSLGLDDLDLDLDLDFE